VRLFLLTLLCAAAGAAVLSGIASAAGPAVTTGPSVSGVAEQGQRLGAVPGIWTGTGTVTYAYQWYRCDATGAHCASVHGATGVGYRLLAADAGKTIGLTVKATDTTGTTSAYASLVGPVAAKGAPLLATTAPKTTGGLTVGAAATVANGTWSSTSATFTYAWQQCNVNGRVCVPISGATTVSYTPTTADAGHALVAVVTATAGANTQTAWSTATAPVKAAPGPTLTAAPVVTGTREQGRKLSATSGTWTGTGTVAYAYQWYRCDGTGAHCSSVHGATRATYTTVAADVGKTIGLTVKATDTTGTIAAYAGLVGPIAAEAAALTATTAPTVTGAPAVGTALTAAGAAWSEATTSTAYSWQRCNANGRICTFISGATSSSYTPTTADAGHTLVAVVTAVAGGVSQAVWSLPTPPVAAG
jgi:hypothetical protein